MSYKDVLGNGPPKLPPDLVESDEEDDEMPDLVTMQWIQQIFRGII